MYQLEPTQQITSITYNVSTGTFVFMWRMSEIETKGQEEVEMEDGHLLIYSGVFWERRAATSAGYIVSGNLVKDVLKWEGWSESILYFPLKSEDGELKMIQEKIKMYSGRS